MDHLPELTEVLNLIDMYETILALIALAWIAASIYEESKPYRK